MVLLRTIFLCLMTIPVGAVTLESVRSLVKDGHIREAVRELENLQKQAPANPDLQSEIGKIFQELAALRAERLEQLAPESPQAHELTGKSLEAHDKLADALAQYQIAAQKDPTLPGIHFLIGNLHWKQRDLEAALPELKAELRLNPHHNFANLRMGQILMTINADHPETAIPYLKEAVSALPMNLEAHRELGKALRMAGHYKEALQELKFVAGHQPEDSKVHAQLAALYRATGDTERARKEMETQREVLQHQREISLQFRQSQSPR